MTTKRDPGKAILELVDKMHEEKKIPREVIFHGIESAIKLAAERHFAVEEGVFVQIDQSTGHIVARHKELELDPETLGRIAAQSAKQVMIQKIREAESDTVYNEFNGKKGELLLGTVTRVDAGTAILSLGKSEALLPRSEQIPGESHQVNDRVKAVVLEVRRQGHRVKIVLSRCHPDFVRALFEEEIPEIEERIIDIRAVAREAGYRSKVAVSSIDLKVDAVGACVGVRGSRIKNVIEELNGERIDIVRWNDALQVLIPNALQPAQISEVFTYPRLGRAIVLVTDDQLSLAIGRRGQNVRLASKLVGWDIEIMTHDELGESLERAERWFGQLPHASPELTGALIEEGFLSYNDLTMTDAAGLAEFSGLDEEQSDEVVMYAEEYSDVMDRSVEQERRDAEAAEAAEHTAREVVVEQPPDETGEAPVATVEDDGEMAASEVSSEPAATDILHSPTEEAAPPNSEPLVVSESGEGEVGGPETASHPTHPADEPPAA